MGKFFKVSNLLPNTSHILEFAPGIPDKHQIVKLPNFTTPQKWEYVLHNHEANRAGQHFDLRLGDPRTGQAHSWVVKSWPAPGEKVLAIQQPTHTVKYMSFEGNIPSGYGAGNVSIADNSTIEVIKSEPDKITFYKYDGPYVARYTLLRTNNDMWLLVNHTSSKELMNYYNIAPKFKMKDLTNKYRPQSGEFIVPKIDGAYATTILRPKKLPIVLSSRISKKTNLPIEYTPKIFDLVNKVSPQALGHTVLRTEVYAVNQEGKEIPNRTLGGILNANVWKSRKMQKNLGSPLRLAITDVLKYKGKDVSNLSAEEKYKLIDIIHSEYPSLNNPLELQKKTKFKEGIVVWRGNKPFKVKNRPDYDYYVRDIFVANTKNTIPRAGGIIASKTPNSPITTNIGTGFTYAELQDMLKNPKTYIGRVAKIQAMEELPSGKLRSPSFKSWHLDKG